MVGVSDPALRRSRREGVALLSSIAVGYLVATILLVIELFLASEALAGLPELSRRVLLIVALTAVGVADLTNRTPYMRRQVPQRFVRDLLPVSRGLLWGLDLGLLFTTQKTVGLLWAVLLWATLQASPGATAIALVVGAAVYLSATLITTLSGSRERPVRLVGLDDQLTRRLRLGSGLTILMLAATSM